MDLLQGAQWHDVDSGGGGGGGAWAAGRAPKRLRTSTSHASILRPIARLVRTPFDTLGLLADGLGYGSAAPPAALSADEQEAQLQRLRLRSATTVDEYQAAAKELDALDGSNEWKEDDASDEYDVELVRARLRRLEHARDQMDYNDMRFQIRTALTRDLGGMGNVRLYQHSRIGTKALIERYIDTVLDTIDVITDASILDVRALHEEMKLTRQAFGRSALLLSGGGTLGMNHIGVVKALYEADMLPRIVSGASAGSIVCAVLCTKTDEEIPSVLEEFCKGEMDVFEKEGESHTIFEKVTRFFTRGAIYDVANLTRVMKNLLGNMTFQEAYNRTQRILNICVSSAGMYEMPRLLNYITSPDVMIWSAVAASCSVPCVFSAAQLEVKDPKTGETRPWTDDVSKWIDGSVDNDLPMTRLAEMLNVNHFIVSQVNPHVVPFLGKDKSNFASDASCSAAALAPGPSWINIMANIAKGEALHRLHVLAELGVFPTAMTKLRSVLGQRYAGDITILPEISYAQFPHILSNPTAEFMQEALYNGERATWPRLSRIRNHLAIELKLDDAVHKLLDRVAFSPSQVDLRMTAYPRPRTAGPTGRGGRGRRGSRASHKSTKSTVVIPRLVPGRQSAHRPIKSMFDPPSAIPVMPSQRTPEQPPPPTDYFSSADDTTSRGSSSTLSGPDVDESDDLVHDTSESPPSPQPALRVPTRDTIVKSASQPATPSVPSKHFAHEAPGGGGGGGGGGARTPTPKVAGFTAIPSPPELKYKKLFHSKAHHRRLPAPAPAAPPEAKGGPPRPPRRFSKLGLNLDLSGTRGKAHRRPHGLGTGLKGFRSPPGEH